MPEEPLPRWDTPRIKSNSSEARDPLSAPKVDAGTAMYLDRLRRSVNYLEFGDPSEFLQATYGRATPPTELDKIWVQPSAREIPFGLGPDQSRTKSSVEVPLERALNTDARLSVLLAQPGNGKSTICRHLACTLSGEFERGDSPRIPIYVPARMLKLGKDGFERALVDAAVRFVGWAGDRGELSQDLQARLNDSFIIIDGLDEVPVEPQPNQEVTVTRERVVELVRYLMVSFGDAKFLVTCREADYAVDSDSILYEAKHWGVSGFTPAQVSKCLARWHAAGEISAREYLGLGDLDWERREEELRELIRSDPEVGTMAGVPLLLNMLQVVFKDAADSPRSVSSLATRAVRFLMVDKPRMNRDARSNLDPDNHDLLLHPNADEWILALLQGLAFLVHARTAAGLERGFTLEEASAASHKAFHVDPRNLDQAGVLAFQAVRHIFAGNGVLAESEGDRWDFTHNVFREVLAGQALADLSLSERVELAKSDAWLLPLRYWAGLTVLERNGLGQVFLLATELQTHARRARANRALYVMASAEVLCEASRALGQAESSAVLDEARHRSKTELENLLRDPRLLLHRRVRVGDLLGALGDPRIFDPGDQRAWRVVGPGSYSVGRDSRHLTVNDKYQDCPPVPECTGEVKGYGVGLFPVTNQEYAVFIADGGYQNPELHESDEAAKWFAQDETFIRQLDQLVESSSKIHFITDITAGRITLEDLEEHRGRLLRRDRPLYWYDPRFNHPNQPVVGVNWWEATAYARWLDRRLQDSQKTWRGRQVRLLDEYRWEIVSRGPANLLPYPWGSDPPEANAHVRGASGVARTCGVGLFPWAGYEGAPLDLIGNVWEWTSSRPDGYSLEGFNQHVDLSGTGDRVVRGSSWMSGEPESPHSTFRSFDPPCNAYEDLGFRLMYADIEE